MQPVKMQLFRTFLCVISLFNQPKAPTQTKMVPIKATFSGGVRLSATHKPGSSLHFPVRLKTR